MRQVAAIHLLALCQAAELRGPEVLSAPTRAAFDHIRQTSGFLDRDRPMDADIERVAGLIAGGGLRTAVEAA